MKKYFKIFSATTFQIICNQLFGLLFFVLLSSDVSKDIFGDLNWSIAVSVTFSVILTFGFDNIVVRKVASGNDTGNKISGTYLSHTVVISFVCISMLMLFWLLFPAFFINHNLFICIFISTLLTFISGPFKQLAVGMEKFWHFAIMNVICNFIRIAGFIVMIAFNKINVFNISFLFIASSGIELSLCFIFTYGILKKPLKTVFNIKLYISLIKESLPQTGTVLLDSAFARMDWILMGILSTRMLTADYSFSYKAFESSRLPLLIIAPILLPKLSRIYSNEENLKQENIDQLNSLWKAESIICVMIPLLLNICWVDIVNLLTHNKYGFETKWVYMVLSMGLPMLFISNYLWTIAFAKGRYKLTFVISAVVTISNIILNIILIPRYNAVGAAIASTSSIFIQVILYAANVREKQLNVSLFDFVKTFLIAGVIIFGMQYISLFWLLKVCIAVIIFFLFMMPTRVFRYFKTIK